jgi:hypothetical protein
VSIFDADKIAPATFTLSSTNPLHKIVSGERYRFFTVATNDIGDSDKSEEVYYTVTTLPQKPQSLMRSPLSTRTQLLIQWNVEPDTDSVITGYSLEMDFSANLDGDFKEIWNGRGRPDVLSFILVVATGRTYHFRHRSFNYNGASAYSDVFSTISCVNPQPPGKPQWITSTTSSITFIWDDPIDDGGCLVREY